MEHKEQRKVDDFIIYAMGAATQALRDAGWEADGLAVRMSLLYLMLGGPQAEVVQ